jgi:predicted RND superfamily exporter protein
MNVSKGYSKKIIQQETFNMTRNEGNTDRIIRLALGIAVIALGFYFRSWFGLIGLIPLVTAGIGWCPLYSIFGLSTCPVDMNKA